MIGNKIRFDREIPECGLIGITGADGIIKDYDWSTYRYLVEFDGGTQAWFSFEDVNGASKSCWHDLQTFVGFNQITNICSKCGYSEPKDMMRR